MLEQYAAALGQTPRVLFGLSQSWQPLVQAMQCGSYVASVAFSPDGSRLASGSYTNRVRIWNTATGELEDELEGHASCVESVAFSHNGRFIVSGSWDKTIRIWNTATCETTFILMGHEGAVQSIAISRNDKLVVSGSSDRTVRMWEAATSELLHELKGHGDRLASVAVSPDCQHVASLSDAGELWIWTKDGVIEHRFKCLDKHDIPHDLAFSNDGSRILCNRTEWTTTGHRLSPMDTNNEPGYMGHTVSMAYSLDDDEVVCGMADGKVMIWNRDTNKTHILGRHSDQVTSVAFSQDGSRIASGSIDGTVRIWDLRLKGMVDEEEPLEELRAVVLSRDGGWIVTAPRHHVQVWRVTETVAKANELITEDAVCCLALSRDGSRVVIGCADGNIWVWNHLTNITECRMSHSGYKFGSVECVAFSYDGRHVVSGSTDGTVQIWDCHMGNEVSMYQTSSLHYIRCVAFSRDGGRVAFGSEISDSEESVQIWNPSTGQIQILPDSETDWMDSVAFSHDDSHVMFGSSSGVLIWNLTTNESTHLLGSVRLPDGTRVHSLGIGHFHIYDPVDETTNNTHPYLLSISDGRDWILGGQAEHDCWISPHYRNFTWAYIAKSRVWLAYRSGSMIVLDLKSTQHD